MVFPLPYSVVIADHPPASHPPPRLDLSGLSLSSEPEMSLLVAAMLQHDPASRPTIQQVG